MNTLSERVVHARELVADRVGDTRINELIRAITVDIDEEAGTDAAYAIEAHVHCHNRGWGRYMPYSAIAELLRLDNDALANEVAGWIQGAIESNYPRKNFSTNRTL